MWIHRVPGVRLRVGRSFWRQAASATGLALLLAHAPGTLAQETSCEGRNPLLSTGTLNLRIDNDLFGADGQDQGYTNGFLVSWVSPNLLDYVDDPCVPQIARHLNRHLAWLSPDEIQGPVEQNMTIGLGQVMYTPKDRMRNDLITDDRPYAGALMFSLGYNARKGGQLRTSQIRMGLVGPAAFARQTQSQWHDVIGVDRFHGWNNQLRNEPVLQLIHERHDRLMREEGAGGWGWDVTRHWGTSLGNFATYANVGAEWRFGLRLPDNFGTAPRRPAGENTSPVNVRADSTWNGHLFAAFDARWVLHDITLDGNTFRASHRVDKRPFVADVGYGFALSAGPWRVSFARYHRTREFKGQRDAPVYGSITIGRRF